MSPSFREHLREYLAYLTDTTPRPLTPTEVFVALTGGFVLFAAVVVGVHLAVTI